MVKKLLFKRIVTPGYMLEDDRIGPADRETYGKLLRLSFKKGYCWPSNSALDGTESGRTASRQITNLEKAGYIKVKNSKGKKRKIIVAGLVPGGEKGTANPAISGDRTVLDEHNIKEQVHEQEMENENAKSEAAFSQNEKGGFVCLDSGTNKYEENRRNTLYPHAVSPQTEPEKDDAPSPPMDRPLAAEESRFIIPAWMACCKFWNGLGLKPECRNFFSLPGRYDRELVKAFQSYSLKEDFNAMTNYSNHLKSKSPDYAPPMIYGSMATFLISGVPRYFDDNAVETLFRVREQGREK
ncbi:MAG: helix-turn-helix domain-containing protein [Spirochaetaceae bacterium]|jgi:hypothetical protein|nr:helix-turn-helix domain-containing protein [Spirochaetaceae bacterium]